jgi:putative hydrolase of the HAD superfamily
MLGDADGIIFDFFGTLTDGICESFRQALVERVADVLGAPPDQFSLLVSSTFSDRACGRLGDVRETLRKLCRELNVDPSDARLNQAVQMRIDHGRVMAKPRDGVLQLLYNMRSSGLRIGIASDCSEELPTVWPELPFCDLVDAVVFSCQEGYKKPDQRMYKTIARRLVVSPQRCLYIGDGGSRELSGARSAGMRAILLDVPVERMLPSFRFDEEEDWNGERISSLSELGVEPDLHPG